MVENLTYCNEALAVAEAELARALSSAGAGLTRVAHGDRGGGRRAQPMRAAELDHTARGG